MGTVAGAQKMAVKRWGRLINCDEVIRLYVGGLSTRRIAAALGASSTRIAVIVKQVGLSRDRLDATRMACPKNPNPTHWRTCRQYARWVWEQTNGPIPKGFAIHHKDKDYTNNVPENLECLSIVDHAYIHHPKNPIPRHKRPARIAWKKAWELKNQERRRVQARARYAANAEPMRAKQKAWRQRRKEVGSHDGIAA